MNIKSLRYYLQNYVPYFYELDMWVRKKIAQRIKKRWPKNHR